MINHIKSAAVFFVLCCFISFIMFWVILGSMQRHKERQRLHYIHEYRIAKTMENLEGRWNLP